MRTPRKRTPCNWSETHWKASLEAIRLRRVREQTVAGALLGLLDSLSPNREELPRLRRAIEAFAAIRVSEAQPGHVPGGLVEQYERWVRDNPVGRLFDALDLARPDFCKPHITNRGAGRRAKRPAVERARAGNPARAGKKGQA